MQQLPEYQNVVNGSLEELAPIVQKYGAPDSPLGTDSSSLTKSFQKAKQRCAEQLASGRPRIMLYGLYNSGKSTLLNALMGEVRAKMDDVPTTDRVDRYEWQGYELLDTPGIDAPKKHEDISEKQLEECQVILFVVSANGTFESKKIFEAMRDVIDSGKRLFIILNDKEGMKAEASAAILQAVQQNLINVGLAPEKAAEFTPCLVNAKWAMDGRLEHDETLVSKSGILELETRIFEEIRRVNGFQIAADLCGHVSKDLIEPLIGLLRRHLDQKETDTLLNESLQLREEYREFCEGLKSRIETACVSLPGRLMACFPDVSDRKALESLDTENIKSRISDACRSYVSPLLEDVRRDVRSYSSSLSKRLQKFLEAPSAEAVGSPRLSEAQAREIEKLLEKVKSLNLETAESSFDMGPLAKGAILVALTEALELLLPRLLIQLPWPFKIVAALLKALAAGLPALWDWIFGSSEDKKRKAEEEYARQLALWRQQLETACRDLSREVVKELQKKILEVCKNAFEPILQQVEAEISKKAGLEEAMQTDVLKLDEIRHRLDTAAAELRAGA